MRRRVIAEAQRRVDADLPLFEDNRVEISDQLERLLRECHRLKIAAHPMGWKTGYLIYSALGYYIPCYTPPFGNRLTTERANVLTTSRRWHVRMWNCQGANRGGAQRARTLCRPHDWASAEPKG